MILCNFEFYHIIQVFWPFVTCELVMNMPGKKAPVACELDVILMISIEAINIPIIDIIA